MIGFGEDASTVYVIDYGASVKMDPVSKKHPSNLAGTPRYASLNTHSMLSKKNKKI